MVEVRNGAGLTEMQQAFVDAMFDPACLGKGDQRRNAASLAGYSPNTKIHYIITPKVAQAVVERAALEIATAAPKASRAMEDILDDPTAVGNRERLAAAAQILDRGGLAKVERIQHEVEVTTPIFILPPKKTDLVPDDQD